MGCISAGQFEAKKAMHTNETLLDRLTTSAIEFLRHAMAEAESNPKFALVHFCAGLELILKARLLREHWSLVVTSKPDLRKFRSGDFESVGLAVAIERLASIVDDQLPKEAQTAFENIARHRNRVVHFVHDIDDATKSKMKESIAADICLGWFHLSNLLQRWSAHFRKAKIDIVKIDIDMRKVRTYLQVAFAKEKAHLDALRTDGHEIDVCPSCGFSSAILTKGEQALHFQRCSVCHFSVNVVDYECSSDGCGIPHRFSSYHAFQPTNCGCGHVITQNDLRKYLEGGQQEDVPTRINCGECGAANTVVRHGNTFVCVECFYDEEDIGECDWCGEHQIGGRLINSSIDGCACCFGPQDED